MRYVLHRRTLRRQQPSHYPVLVRLSVSSHFLLSAPPGFRSFLSGNLSDIGGVAHGFQSLADASEVFYQIAERYTPEASAGVRWDDPAFGIDWPICARILSDRDAGYGDFSQGTHP